MRYQCLPLTVDQKPTPGSHQKHAEKHGKETKDLGRVQEGHDNNTTVRPTRGGSRDSQTRQLLYGSCSLACTYLRADTSHGPIDSPTTTDADTNPKPTPSATDNTSRHATPKIPEPTPHTTHPHPKQVPTQRQPPEQPHEPIPDDPQHEPGTICLTDYRDRRNPYPRTTEGKAAYETAIQAWWNRNGFNARATAADLIPLTPGTARTGTRDCYSCRRNDRGDARFPHSSEDCTITPKIPAQEWSWRVFCGNQARAATITDQQNQGSIQQIEEYETHQEQASPTNLNQGNGEEPTA